HSMFTKEANEILKLLIYLLHHARWHLFPEIGIKKLLWRCTLDMSKRCHSPKLVAIPVAFSRQILRQIGAKKVVAPLPAYESESHTVTLSHTPVTLICMK